jgi:hypothetical protein
LTIISAQLDSSDRSSVQLKTFPQQNIQYGLTVKGVVDADGYALEKQNTLYFHGDVAPSVVSVSSYSNTQVVVYLSEEVEQVSAETVSNYTITPSLGVVSATRDSADWSKVLLVTDSQSGATTYTLTVNGVTDLTGNPVASPNSGDFVGTDPVDTTPPDVVSAVMIDSNTVEVQFSEPVEQTGAEDISNYLIEDDVGVPETVSAAVRQADASKVRVDIAGTFSKSVYYVEVSTLVEDLAGNPLLGSPENRVSFAGEGTSITLAQATSNTGVRVFFSNDVPLPDAEVVGNYSIPGLTVLGATRDGADFSIVDLTTSAQLGVTYTLTVSGVIDPSSMSFDGDVSPYLSTVSSTANTEVVVHFSEEVEQVSAETLANYSITPALNVVSATRDGADWCKVTLQTDSQSGAVTYTLTANGVVDLTGNPVASPNSKDFVGTDPVDTTPPDVVSAVLVDSDTVEVQFSEPVELTSAEDELNYLIEDGVGVPETVNAAVRQADASKVRVDIGGMFSKSVYYVEVSTLVEDLAGNALLGSPENRESFAGEGTSLSLVQATSNTGVRVFFSGEVPLPDAEVVGNYSIPGLTVVSAVRDGADYRIVDLTTSAHEDVNYTLNVSGVIEPDSAVFGGDVDPYIVSVSSYGNTDVVVYFSEPVDLASAETASNYSIVGLTVMQATRDGVDVFKVILDTSSQIDSTIYTLTVTGVTDLNGNPMAMPNYEDFYGTGTTDWTQPTVVSATLIDSDTVEVQFSEPMDMGSAETVSNYTIVDNLGGTVFVSIATMQPDPSKVRLDVLGSFSESLYTLSVDPAVMDLSFNGIAPPPNDTVSFAGEGAIPETPGDGPIMIDPMGEGTNNFGMLTKYRGRIYIGPADADNAVYRIKPDGSDPELVSFRFHVGSTYSNSLDPGPYGEDGIDYIAGGLINGTEYLFIGPSRSSGSLSYIYYTSDSGNNLDFSPMDIGGELGGQTKGVSAITVFNDKLYVGFPDTGGSRPYLHKIVNIMETPQKDIDYFNLEGKEFPRIGASGSPSNNSGTVGIDSFGIFQDKLFFANGGNNTIDEDGGIVRSTVADPAPYSVSPADWEDVTPTVVPEWYDGGTRFSSELLALNKLIPSDKAFPAMTVFNGRLYVIRNTDDFSNRPQLWKYDGISWSLVADNGTGVCNMGNPNNSAASLLVVNGDRLYIGYDNSNTGVQVWRTLDGVTEPLAEGDFEPVSTDGFGDPANNQRIYHGLSISSGGEDYLWLLSGKSGGIIHVYRTNNQ